MLLMYFSCNTALWNLVEIRLTVYKKRREIHYTGYSYKVISATRNILYIKFIRGHRISVRDSHIDYGVYGIKEIL